MMEMTIVISIPEPLRMTRMVMKIIRLIEIRQKHMIYNCYNLIKDIMN